jgi:hypothetical protein
MNQGWIKLHRALMDWEWYDDIITRGIFIHCLLRANHTDTNWRGIELKRGQFVTSLKHLAEENGISVQTLRTHLKRLKSTRELTIKSTNKNSIITVCKYESYQSEKSEANTQTNTQANKQVTSNQQATNIQLTTDKNDKNNKNVNNEKNHHQAEKNDDDDLISLIDIEKLKKEYKGIDVLKELQEIEKKISGQKISVPENYVRQCLNNMLQKRKIAAASSDDYRHFDDSDYMSGIPTGIKVVTF